MNEKNMPLKISFSRCYPTVSTRRQTIKLDSVYTGIHQLCPLLSQSNAVALAHKAWPSELCVSAG